MAVMSTNGKMTTIVLRQSAFEAKFKIF